MRISGRFIARLGIALFAAACIAFVGRTALAGPGHGMRGAGGPALLSPMLLHSADLTSDQQTKLKQIRSSYRSSAKTLFTQLKSANDALNAKLLGPGQVAASDLTPLVTQVAQIRQQLFQQ